VPASEYFAVPKVIIIQLDCTPLALHPLYIASKLAVENVAGVLPRKNF
jgi:hypothetical protein